jgi:hypothetical protein
MTPELHVMVRLSDGTLERAKPLVGSTQPIEEDPPQLKVMVRLSDGTREPAFTEPDREATRRMLADGTSNLGASIMRLSKNL